MARPQGLTATETLPPGEREAGYSFQVLNEGRIEVDNVTDGMVNRASRNEVPPGSARLILNGRVRDDWTGRRPGTTIFGPEAVDPEKKPNDDPILALVTFVAETGTVHICRVTANSFHVLAANQNEWIEYDILDQNGAATSFTGVHTRFSFAQFFDNMFIADDAQNRIWVVDFQQQTVKKIAGAPRARDITMFAERIIAAGIRAFVGGNRPSAVQWPVNADPFDWEGIGSGFEDLAAQNIGDPISRIFGFERELLILRRRSIWEGSRQPFADAPFRFLPVIDDVGCDLPHTAVKVPTGIIYADQRTRDVYFYRPGALPEALAGGVNRDLFEDLGNLQLAQAAYDPFEKEYHLGLVLEGESNITRTWVYSLEKGAWALDDDPEISCIGVVVVPGASPIIDDLIGTINEQFPEPTGAIRDYREAGGFRPSILKGTANGDVLIQTMLAGEDYDDCQFKFVFRSPNVGSISHRRTVKDLLLSVETFLEGDYVLGILKHDRPAQYATIKEGTLDPGKYPLRLPKRSVTGNDLYWEIQTNSPGFRIYSWWMRLLEKGPQR